MNNKSQWVIVDKTGCQREGAYETRVEAVVALECMRLAAVREMEEAKERAIKGIPRYTDDTALKAVSIFASCEWRVKDEPLSNSVYRLNADITQDERFLREVLWKLRVCGKVEIHWTCIGRTRSEMQGASTAAFLSGYGYSAIVASGGDVIVSAARKEAF